MMRVLMDDRCEHEMLVGTCAICLKLELPSNVAAEDFYCAQCRSVVWRGDSYTVKMITDENGVKRNRRVGECCSDD